MFENFRTFETTYAGRPVVVETGKTCGLANGSCWVRYGETVVMANVTASAKPREGVDFFPLSVDFEEKMYAVGRIPGSFTKREGKASDIRQTGDEIYSMYSPKSVVEAMLRHKFGTYWNQTETYEALKIYIQMDMDGLKDSVVRMLAGINYNKKTKKHECVIEAMQK